jgi:hypothetical protein
MRGLDPEHKSARAANYVRALRAELLALSRSMGVTHPALLTPENVEIVGERYQTARVEDIFGYDPGWCALSPDRVAEIEHLVGPSDGGPAPPGPEGGPIAGDEAGGEEHGDRDLAEEGAGGGMAAGGD